MRHPGRRALPGGRRDVHDRSPALPQGRQGRANRAHVAHDVQLPVGIPLLVEHLLEARLPRDADVVDENVEAAERVHRRGDGVLGLAGERQVSRHVCDLAGSGRIPAPARDDARALSDELTRDLEPDPGGRAGNQAPLAVETEIHGRLG